MNLFKYFEPNRIDVLQNLKIRFSPSYAFNDPFESFPYIENLITPEFAEDLFTNQIEDALLKDQDKNIINYLPDEDLINLPAEYLNYLKNKTLGDLMREINFKDLFKNDLQQMPNHISRANLSMPKILKDKFAEQFGILSLTKKKDNLIMWAHYAKNHEGFVIEFNTQHPFFNQTKNEADKIRKLYEVRYVKERPVMTLYTPEMPNGEFLQYLMDNIFLSKSKDWKNEKEWRIILELKDATEVFQKNDSIIHLFQFPENLIKSVYLGVRMPISVIIHLITQVL